MTFNWKDYYYYDETSPSCLRFKVCRGNRKANAVAGSMYSGSRYYRIKSRNGQSLVHRIIWILFNGNIPEGMVIDRVDGDTFNNRIGNLRCVTLSLNSRNQVKSKLNKSGVTGVYYEGGRNPRWRAEWLEQDGRSKTKSFSVNKYGYDEAFQRACLYREWQIEIQNSLGGGYSERHGK